MLISAPISSNSLYAPSRLNSASLDSPVLSASTLPAPPSVLLADLSTASGTKLTKGSLYIPVSSFKASRIVSKCSSNSALPALNVFAIGVGRGSEYLPVSSFKASRIVSKFSSNLPSSVAPPSMSFSITSLISSEALVIDATYAEYAS